jgi:hypothetical protein
VVTTTVSGSSTSSTSWSGPDSARPVNVLKTESVTRSYITLFERDSSPDVRRMGVSTPSGTASVRKAWAAPHSVQ